MAVVTFRNPAAEFALQLALQQQQPQPSQPTVIPLRPEPTIPRQPTQPAVGNLVAAARGGKKLIGALGSPTSSGLTQAQATQILTSPSAFGGGVTGGAALSGLTQAQATQILTSPAAYGGTGGAAGAGFASNLSALGPAAATVALPFVARALFGGGNENIAKADRIFAAGKGKKGPLGIQMTRAGDATFLSGSPEQLSRVAAAAQLRDTSISEIRPDLLGVTANLDNTRALLKFAEQAKDLNVSSFEARKRQRNLQRRRTQGGR